MNISVAIFTLVSIHGESNGDPTAFLLIAGPAAGLAFFQFVFRYYRNIDKRHAYESSVNVKSAVTKSNDHFIKEVTRSSQDSIRNGNYGMPTWRIGKEMPLELKTFWSKKGHRPNLPWLK